MPSWHNVEEAINFTVQSRKDVHPELFAASRQAKSMPYDEHGRQSVAYITEMQFPTEPVADIHKMNRALKDLQNDIVKATPMPVPLSLLREAPDPHPTETELWNRAALARCDKIGHLKPEAAFTSSRDKWGPTAMPEWIAALSDLAKVESRGGLRQFPRSAHARQLSYDPYHHRQWYEEAAEVEHDPFAGSLFRANNARDQRPAYVQRRQVTSGGDASVSGQWEQYVPRTEYVSQPMRYQRDYHTMGAHRPEKPFDV